MLHIVFKTLIYFLGIFLSEIRAFHLLFSIGKRFQKKRLDRIRFPFLRNISPYRNNYTTVYRENFKEYRISSHMSKGTIFYIHGGGLISGDFAGYNDFCFTLSETCQRNIVFPEYNLSPEYTLEKMLSDIYNSYTDIRDKNIVIISDSAGCYLSNLLINKLEEENKDLPSGLVYISPNTNLIEPEESDYMFDKDFYGWIWEQTKNKIEYRMSDIYSLIIYSHNECFAKHIEEEYKDRENCILDVSEGFHAYPLFYRYFSSGKKALEKMKSFVNSIPRNY